MVVGGLVTLAQGFKLLCTYSSSDVQCRCACLCIIPSLSRLFTIPFCIYLYVYTDSIYVCIWCIIYQCDYIYIFICVCMYLYRIISRPRVLAYVFASLIPRVRLRLLHLFIIIVVDHSFSLTIAFKCEYIIHHPLVYYMKKREKIKKINK